MTTSVRPATVSAFSFLQTPVRSLVRIRIFPNTSAVLFFYAMSAPLPYLQLAQIDNGLDPKEVKECEEMMWQTACFELYPESLKKGCVVYLGSGIAGREPYALRYTTEFESGGFLKLPGIIVYLSLGQKAIWHYTARGGRNRIWYVVSLEQVAKLN
jgi:hypothetical protein